MPERRPQGPGKVSGLSRPQGASASGLVPPQGVSVGGGGTVERVATLPSPRDYPGAAYVPSTGNIYVVAGRDSAQNHTDTIFEVDPSAGTSQQIGTLPDPPGPIGFNSGGAPGDGFMYSIGGYDPDLKGGSTITDIFRVDPSNGNVTKIADLPSSSDSGDSCSFSGDTSLIFYSEGNHAVFWIDVSAGTTGQVNGDLPTQRWYTGAAEDGNGNVYRIGGQEPLGPDADEVSKADYSADTASQVDTLPVTRKSSFAASFGGTTIYMPAGIESGSYVDHVSTYDAADQSYVSDIGVGPFPHGLAYHATCVDKANQRLFTVGGVHEDGSTILDDVFEVAI